MFHQQSANVQVKRQRSATGHRVLQLGLIVHRSRVTPLVKDVDIGATRSLAMLA